MEKFSLITLFISLLVITPISALLLMAATCIFKLEDRTYKTAVKVIALSNLFSLLVMGILQVFNVVTDKVLVEPQWFGLVVVLSLLTIIFVLPIFILVKRIYKISWKKVFSVTLVWLIFYLLVLFFVINPLWAIFSFVTQNLSVDPSML